MKYLAIYTAMIWLAIIVASNWADTRQLQWCQDVAITDTDVENCNKMFPNLYN